MPIDIRETFQVDAPIDAVWRFVMDPHSVVTCMPGAALDEVVDAQTFLGTVKIKVGAITTSYKGRVQFTELDENEHTVRMLAEGRETGGGMAKGTMSSRLRAVAPAQTEVVAEASVDLTGRIMQVGRGMIQGVAHQLFLQFVARIKESLEGRQAPAAGSDAVTPGAAPSGTRVSAENVPIRVLPLILGVMWSAIARFFRRLVGRPAQPQ